VQRRAGDAVLVGESAAAWRATVGQREDDEALQAAEGVPDGLVGIARLGYAQPWSLPHSRAHRANRWRTVQLVRIPSGVDTMISIEDPLMTEDQTEAGTPVLEFDAREYRAFLEREVQRGLGLSVDEFVSRYRAGELDEGDPDVSDLAGLLWLGQNGHRAAA
jgi:hypothetical protein